MVSTLSRSKTFNFIKELRKWGSLFAFRRENGDRYSQFAAKMGIAIRNSQYTAD